MFRHPVYMCILYIFVQIFNLPVLIVVNVYVQTSCLYVHTIYICADIQSNSTFLYWEIYICADIQSSSNFVYWEKVLGRYIFVQIFNLPVICLVGEGTWEIYICADI
jgi:hypothetical protein